MIVELLPGSGLICLPNSVLLMFAVFDRYAVYLSHDERARLLCSEAIAHSAPCHAWSSNSISGGPNLQPIEGRHLWAGTRSGQAHRCCRSRS